jgi:hypothetical protein
MNEKSNSNDNSLSLLKVEIKKIIERKPPNEKIIEYHLQNKIEEE